jgi:uncharacterized protein
MTPALQTEDPSPAGNGDSIEFVKSQFEAFGRGDIPALLASLAPDCEWIVEGPGVPLSGHYTGPDEVGRFFNLLHETEEILRFEVWDYFTNSAGDVVAHGFEECRIRANGRIVSTNWMMLFRVRGGKVARYESFYNTAAYALAHSGSRV